MADSKIPDFYIKNIPVHGKFVLAPMDGFTDSPMRQIARSFGSALSISEFLNAIDVIHGHPHLRSQTFFEDSERPFIFQIYDDKPDRFLEAANRMVQLNPDAIDINLGCSVRKISNRGAGAGLLRHPEKIKLIAESLVKTLPVPVTAKIRLGWDEDSLNYIETARLLEDCGVSMIAVHARTREQEYSGEARWHAIAEVKSAVRIPVIGNGDVRSYNEGLRMLSETGCDGVMIGRAAIGNPWIFAGKDRSSIPANELFAVLQRHLNLMVGLYGEGIAVPMFRKHLIRYLHEHLATPEIRRQIFTIDQPALLLQDIEKLLTEKGN